MNIDFIKNQLVIDNRHWHMDAVRFWLLRNYDQLCNKLFLKSIVSKGQRRFTYDWDTIIDISKQSGYLLIFHNKYKTMHAKVHTAFTDSRSNFYGFGAEIPTDQLQYFTEEEQKNFAIAGTSKYDEVFAFSFTTTTAEVPSEVPSEGSPTVPEIVVTTQESDEQPQTDAAPKTEDDVKSDTTLEDENQPS